MCTPLGFSPDDHLEMLDLLPVTSQVYTKPVSPKKMSVDSFCNTNLQSAVHVVSRFGTCIPWFASHLSANRT